MIYKVGIGYDVHSLEIGKPFMLGGIKLNHIKGSVGHSDADVLIHAICDALLGALNLRDIGFHFPDNEKKYEGIDSKILLKKVIALMFENKFEISNVDSTVCLQAPKLKDYIHEMKLVLAKCMQIKLSQISIKATTTEKLGFVGREEGVSCYAVVMIKKLVS
tara:strand:+ start:8852 stop:9337 length:486 start_codon:yes stop_codon:yes gene_type:complete